MSEEKTEGMDTVPTGETAPQDTGTVDSQKTTPDFFVATYRKKEDAEAGIKEKDTTIDRLKAERDRLRSEYEESRSEFESLRNKQVEILDRLSQPQKEPEQTGKAYEELEEELAEEARQDPGAAAKKTLRMAHSWLTESERKQTEKSEKKLAEYEKKISALESELLKQTLSPTEKELVVKIQAASGMDFSTARKIAQVVSVGSEHAETRTAPPPFGGTGRVREETAKPISDAGTGFIRSVIPDLTDEEMKTLGIKKR